METTLSDKISQLRTAIQQVEGLPGASREQLLHSLDDLERNVPAEEEAHLPLMEQVEESLLELEAKHPDTARLLASMGNTLGRMGL